MKIEHQQIAYDCLKIKEDLKLMLKTIEQSPKIYICDSFISVSNKIGGINTDEKLRELICNFIREEQQRINEILVNLE